MKRISVTRDVSGFSGRRRGSQKLGTAVFWAEGFGVLAGCATTDTPTADASTVQSTVIAMSALVRPSNPEFRFSLDCFVGSPGLLAMTVALIDTSSNRRRRLRAGGAD